MPALMDRPDDAAVRVLVDNYTRFLEFLERRVESRDVAEDILQEAFVRGVDRAPDLPDDESVTAWFYRVLRNAVTDHYRRRSARERAHAYAAGIAPQAEPPLDAEMFDAVCGCVNGMVDSLKHEYADAIRRVDLDGVPVRDYAREIGITASNAGVRLHRARSALRSQLVRACGTCSEHGCLDCRCKVEPGT